MLPSISDKGFASLTKGIVGFDCFVSDPSGLLVDILNVDIVAVCRMPSCCSMFNVLLCVLLCVLRDMLRDMLLDMLLDVLHRIIQVFAAAAGILLVDIGVAVQA